MLAISTHYAKSFSEADEPQIAGYPPPAQILGQLMDAIFLDVIDEDTGRLERAKYRLEIHDLRRRHVSALTETGLQQRLRELPLRLGHLLERQPIPREQVCRDEMPVV